MKYFFETPVKGIIGTQKYKTAIHWRNGVMFTDEPEKLGGKDLGPDPYTLLLSSIIACTLATLRMYIDHKELDIPEIKIEANLYQKIIQSEIVTYIERTIDFGQDLEEGLKERLLEIADKCPVSNIVKGDVNILTGLKE